MRPWVLGQIAEEAAAEEAGRITIKANGLTDPEVIDALYVASQAGVQIDLIVRGICSLRPGVPGLSGRITVRSIMGRFLEHSRIYRFGDPGGERPVRYTIGSGDLMERNLDRRIEVLVPVLDPELAALASKRRSSSTSPTTPWPGSSGPMATGSGSYPCSASAPSVACRSSRSERARRRRSPEKLS